LGRSATENKNEGSPDGMKFEVMKSYTEENIRYKWARLILRIIKWKRSGRKLP